MSLFRPVTLCGLPAVLACFRHRPAALKRLLFDDEHARALEPVCDWLAEQHRPFCTATFSELARASGNAIHNGVVALTERPPPATPAPSDFDKWRAAATPLLFLDDVADPVQIGTAARVAVAMGLTQLLLGGVSANAVFHSLAWSTAAGALDQLTFHDAGDTALLLRGLREKFCVVGFARPGGRRVSELKPIRVPGRPLAIVIGDTETGLAPNVASKCEHLLHIPGVRGSTLLNAGDAAAYGLPWLFEREHKTGFLAAKRERQRARESQPE